MVDRPTITDAIVHLDYATLKDTIYERCKLVFSGGRPPLLLGCDFIDCEFILDGAAQNTQMFLATLARSGAGELVVHSMLGMTNWVEKKDG